MKNPYQFYKQLLAFSLAFMLFTAQVASAAENKLRALEESFEMAMMYPGMAAPGISGVTDRTFDYDYGDKLADSITRDFDKPLTRVGQATQVIGGGAGTVIASVETAASVVTANPVGVGLGTTAAGFSASYALDGYDAWTSPYKSETGSRALSSLKSDLSGPTGATKLAFSGGATILDLTAAASVKNLATATINRVATPAQISG